MDLYIYILYMYIGTIIAHKKDCIHEAFSFAVPGRCWPQDISNMLQVARNGGCTSFEFNK